MAVWDWVPLWASRKQMSVRDSFWSSMCSGRWWVRRTDQDDAARSQQIAALVEESAAATESLRNQAQQLLHAISIVKLSTRPQRLDVAWLVEVIRHVLQHPASYSFAMRR